MNNRTYNKLFFGLNESSGYDKPALLFNTSAKRIVLHPDVHNIFTYPEYAIQEALSAANCTLILDGATPGAVPLHADIIKYDTDCNPKGSLSMDDSFGTYIGTWLYKGDQTSSVQGVWYDRWYNPVLISKENALNEPLNLASTSVSKVKDAVTRLQLRPGIKYDYFHFGHYTNNEIVKQMDNYKNLYLQYDLWSPEEENYNELIFENTTTTSDKNLIVNRDTPSLDKPIKEKISVDDNQFLLNKKTRSDTILDLTAKTSYAAINYTPENNTSGNITTSIWFKNLNFSSHNQKYILGNGFRSGWNILIDGGFYTPLLTVVGTTNVVVYNTEMRLFGNYDLSPVIGNILTYITDEDLFMYIVGTRTQNPSEHAVYKLDLTTGLIIETETYTDLNGAHTILINRDKNTIIVYTGTREVSINRKTLALTSASIFYTTNADYYYTNNSLNNIIGSQYPVEIDNYNYVWEARPDGIYREGIKLYNGEPVALKCSHDDKLWVLLREETSYAVEILDISNSKLIAENNFLSLKNTSLNKVVLNIDTSTPKTSLLFDLLYNDGTIGYVVDTFNNNIYKTNFSGDIANIEEFYNPNLNYNFNNGALTLYSHYRKFNYIYQARQPTIKIILSTINSSGTISEETFIYRATELKNDKWQHIALTIDQNTRTIKTYLNTKLIIEDSYTGNNIYYIYETPLTIGSQSGRTGILSKELNDKTYGYLNGYVDDFRLYNTVLENYEIERIHNNKFRYNTINYNIPSQIPFNYIEEIERFFKFKLPGSKSQLYNIKISGFKNASDETKQTIEGVIFNTVKYVAPAYTELYKISWID